MKGEMGRQGKEKDRERNNYMASKKAEGSMVVKGGRKDVDGFVDGWAGTTNGAREVGAAGWDGRRRRGGRRDGKARKRREVTAVEGGAARGYAGRMENEDMGRRRSGVRGRRTAS
jgi:hypothetical protein